MEIFKRARHNSQRWMLGGTGSRIKDGEYEQTV
jgi:hypothetical protein